MRFTDSRIVNGETEVFDSNNGIWINVIKLNKVDQDLCAELIKTPIPEAPDKSEPYTRRRDVLKKTADVVNLQTEAMRPSPERVKSDENFARRKDVLKDTEAKLSSCNKCGKEMSRGLTMHERFCKG